MFLISTRRLLLGRWRKIMRPSIYLYGDSITEASFDDGGWGASLAHHFSRTVDIILRGYGGYNTRWALKVLDRVFPAAEGDGVQGSSVPLAAVVFFGANDACLLDRCSGFQHVPLDEYSQNLHSIVSSIKKRWQNTVVLLVTPPPIDEVARLRDPYCPNESGLPERTNEAAGRYAKACIAVASECGMPVVDVYTKIQELPNWGEACLSDGLHLSRQGNKLVFEAVVEKLREAGLSLENLRVDLPLITEVDPKDPLKSFE